MVPKLLEIILDFLLLAELLDFFEEEVELNLGAVHQVPGFQILYEFVEIADLRMLGSSKAIDGLWLHCELSEQSFQSIFVLKQVLFFVGKLFPRSFDGLLLLWSLSQF